MKIVTIVGARPQFIKAAAVSRKLRLKDTEILVHTGQHYDTNMSELFFKELHIPEPDYRLSAGSGSHAKQTAAMLVGIEEILYLEKPDYIMVYGDTNSTLAGALAASKLCIPVIHIEAGLRSYNRNMPEEQNRILCDHLSDLLFCPTDTAAAHLKEEGIRKGVYQVGDVMCDAVLYYSSFIEQKPGKEYFGRQKGLHGNVKELDRWYLSTIHRAENTDTIGKIKEILDAFEELDYPVLFPVHPRTKPLVEEAFRQFSYKNTICLEPAGYLDMLYFMKHAVKIITDSGGLQKEAYILNTPCVTVREETEWVETLRGNCNVLAHVDKKDIVEKTLYTRRRPEERENYYGTGGTADKICEIVRSVRR